MLTGYSASIKTANKVIREAAKTDDSLLLIGPPGTGKQLIAQILHNKSHTRPRALIHINCSELGDPINCHDLFGYEDRSEGQIARRLGVLDKIKRGTLFLENLHEMPQAYQSFFMNLIESHAYFSPESQENVECQFRAIASIPDESYLEASNIRRDLINKLQSFTITLTPLQKRREDIPHLFTYFLEKFCDEARIEVPPISEEIFESIMAYEWNGNVDELKNAVKNLVLLSPEGRLYAEYLPFEVRKHPFAVLEDKELPAAIAEVERYLIHKALQRFTGNQTKAAHLLNVSEAALRYKMKKYSLSKKAF